MADPQRVELLIDRREGRLAGVLVVTPGFAYAFTQAPAGDELAFVPTALQANRAPYFAPAKGTVEADAEGLRLTVEWQPFDDCVAAPSKLTLARHGGDAAEALAWWRAQLQRIAVATGTAQRRRAEAAPHAQALHEALRARRGAASPDTIASANMLAQYRGPVVRGAPAAVESASLFEAVRADHPVGSRLWQMACMDVASSLYQAGRLREALDGYRHCFDAAAPLLDPLNRNQLDGLAWIAFLYGRVEEHVQAREVGREALARHIALYGRNSEPAANIALNLFNTELRLGRPFEALELAEYSYLTRLKLHGPDHPQTLRALNMIGVIQSSWLRQPEVALPIFERVHAGLGRIDGDADIFLRELKSGVAFNLANTRRNAGLVGPALEAVGEAMRLAEALDRPGEPQNHDASLLNVTLLVETGAVRDAVQAGEAALARIEQHLPPDSAARVIALTRLGIALRRDGQIERARAVLSDAGALARRVYTPTTAQRLATLGSLAELLVEQGQLAEATSLLREVVDGTEALIAQAAALGDTRAGAFSGYAEAYRELGRALVGQGAFDEALQVTQRAKARLLLESVTLRGALQAEALSLAEREELGRLDAARAAAERRVLAASPLARPEAEIERNRAVRQFNAHLDRLRSTYPRFGRLTEIEIATTARAAGALDPGALFVEFVLGERGLLVFLLARDRPLQVLSLPPPPGLAAAVDAYRVALLPAAMRAGLKAWRRDDGGYVAAADRPGQAVQPVEDAQEIGRWLAQHLLEPAGATLARYRRWVLAPDAAFAHLPFEALPWRGAPLVSTVAVSTTQSLSVYLAGRRTAPAPATRRWLGFGAPDYVALNESLARTQAGDPVQLALRGPQPGPTLRNSYEPLPHALEELRSVAPLFRRGTLVVGGDASERALRRLSADGELARFEILHFAAHATLDAKRPALSALVLAATGDSADEDGLVTASEWTGLRVASELVVLSACETGLGQRVSGEGVLGLPYAMFVAGNRNAVLTLWPVADDTTAKFMRAYLARLARGERVSTALVATKREFAAGRHGRRERDPFYWAAFVLVGPD